ncbi:MAG: XdhC family protein [Gammaproteobacteria bacterium]|nr:XdhC family protein [Gammaproteobacteria bacterium]MBU1489568.1 XdhC family protein [Gammaproteobacteria bacterium]MBU2067813.1 XdhC family protein [Gammaproteobacteria bacterium]MBU2140996.1 XdhC family protein [Gammaproteobacteria bacterium]MBU2217373.1 XdhC family protein [Gammaproteobacteria bacterium]
MQHLDLQVIEQALGWSRAGEAVWLCTVLGTFGSSPREPGSLLAARCDGSHVGSLSGGCVEEDFLERLQAGEFERTVTVLRYGDPDGPQGARIALPCGGILKVLIERLPADAATWDQLERLHATLRGQQHLLRSVDLRDGQTTLSEDDGLGPRVVEAADGLSLQIRVGPAARLIVAGISPVAVICAQFAHTLGFEVIVCDPREEAYAGFDVPGVELRKELPSQFIAADGCHSATAVVALTHDPRIDDLAMIEAVRTQAFYIGVMGSQRTSAARAERLRRVGGLSEADIARLHMPVGLALGSKTPAEIALAAIADIVRVYRGRPRDAL